MSSPGQYCWINKRAPPLQVKSWRKRHDVPMMALCTACTAEKGRHDVPIMRSSCCARPPARGPLEVRGATAIWETTLFTPRWRSQSLATATSVEEEVSVNVFSGHQTHTIATPLQWQLPGKHLAGSDSDSVTTVCLGPRTPVAQGLYVVYHLNT